MGLHCYSGSSPVVVHGLLMGVAFPVAQHGLWRAQAAVVAACGLSSCDSRPLEDRLGEGDGTPLQYSRLENPRDRGAWWAAVHGVAKSWTGLSDFTFIFHFHALEKEMATHSSVLAWRIPGTEEPGGLLSMGSHRVRHD